MAGTITDFYPGTTKAFSITISLNGSAPDIGLDTVTFRIKSKKADTDATAILSKVADVTTFGATGKALFTLTPTNTNVAEGSYYCDVTWVKSTGEEYVIYNGEIAVLERVSDA